MSGQDWNWLRKLGTRSRWAFASVVGTFLVVVLFIVAFGSDPQTWVANLLKAETPQPAWRFLILFAWMLLPFVLVLVLAWLFLGLRRTSKALTALEERIQQVVFGSTEAGRAGSTMGSGLLGEFAETKASLVADLETTKQAIERENTKIHGKLVSDFEQTRASLQKHFDKLIQNLNDVALRMRTTAIAIDAPERHPGGLFRFERDYSTALDSIAAAARNRPGHLESGLRELSVMGTNAGFSVFLYKAIAKHIVDGTYNYLSIVGVDTRTRRDVKSTVPDCFTDLFAYRILRAVLDEMETRGKTGLKLAIRIVYSESDMLAAYMGDEGGCYVFQALDLTSLLEVLNARGESTSEFQNLGQIGFSFGLVCDPSGQGDEGSDVRASHDRVQKRLLERHNAVMSTNLASDRPHSLFFFSSSGETESLVEVLPKSSWGSYRNYLKKNANDKLEKRGLHRQKSEEMLQELKAMVTQDRESGKFDSLSDFGRASKPLVVTEGLEGIRARLKQQEGAVLTLISASIKVQQLSGMTFPEYQEEFE